MLNELYKNLVPETVCEKCLDTGVFRSISAEVLECPNIVMNFAHAKPNWASKFVQTAVQSLKNKDYFIHAHTFEFARILTHYKKSNPFKYMDAVNFLCADTNFTFPEKMKKFDLMCNELQTDWELPLGGTSFGIYINTGEENV
jgi:hypothetical protein